MLRNTLLCAALAAMSVSSLYGDFRYDESARITGGMMAGMMKVAGVFSKQAREPINSTVAVQGNRMVRKYADHAEVIDLDAETMTEINFPRKTYSVTTFAEMRQAMEEAFKKANSSGEKQPEVNFKVSVKETGQSKTVAGFPAREAILTLEMESTDPESGRKGSMLVTSDMWLASKMAGYDEVAGFMRRFAEKMNFVPGGGMFMANPQIARGMAGLMKESGKLDGVPVLQVVTMGFKGEGQPEGTGQASAAPQAQPAPRPEPKAEAPSVGGALGGALGGRLGRLGGLGRRKPKEEPKQEQPAPEPQAQQSAQPQGGPVAASLIEMTTEMSGFSNAGVDPAQFQVPAGFKKVESERLKRMR